MNEIIGNTDDPEGDAYQIFLEKYGPYKDRFVAMLDDEIVDSADSMGELRQRHTNESADAFLMVRLCSREDFLKAELNRKWFLDWISSSSNKGIPPMGEEL